MTKRIEWSMYGALEFAIHAIDHGCSTSIGPGSRWLSVMVARGDAFRSVNLDHDGSVYGMTINGSGITLDVRRIDAQNVDEWCAYLGIPAIEVK